MKNYTPHIVTVRDQDGIDHVFPPSGQVARVAMVSTPGAPLEDGTPTVTVSYGAAELPPGHRMSIPIVPAGMRAVAVVSEYFGHHSERGEGDEAIHVLVPNDRSKHAVRASHGSHCRRYIWIDGVEYQDDDASALIADETQPEPCIVSTMFADAYRSQHPGSFPELFIPDSGPSAIRENGQIVAVRALIRR